LSIGALINAPVEVNYVLDQPDPWEVGDKGRAQIQEGLANVTARIRGAIAQAQERR